MDRTEIPWKVTEWDDDKCLDGVQLFIRDNQGLAIVKLYNEGRGEQAQANADFIVRAVNAHDELLSALKKLLKVAPTTAEVEAVIPDAQAAIRKAEGKPEIVAVHYCEACDGEGYSISNGLESECSACNGKGEV